MIVIDHYNFILIILNRISNYYFVSVINKNNSFDQPLKMSDSSFINWAKVKCQFFLKVLENLRIRMFLFTAQQWDCNVTFKIRCFDFCCQLLNPDFVLVAIVIKLFKRFILFGDSPGCGNTFSNFSFICIKFQFKFFIYLIIYFKT